MSPLIRQRILVLYFSAEERLDSEQNAGSAVEVSVPWVPVLRHDFPEEPIPPKALTVLDCEENFS